MNEAVGFLGAAYLWVKAAHVIFVIFWMAGLFVLPRYLVHQAGEVPGSPEDRKWTERVAKLRRVVLGPSLVVVWLLGLLLVANHGLAGAGWLHAKLVLVLLLSGYHGWMTGLSKKMAQGQRPMTERKLRLWNELPALFIVAIVVLAEVKPF